jgi:polysaccharide export outer membrane protein
MHRIPLLALLALLLAGSAPADEGSGLQDDYIIGVEDLLRIVTWGEPDLTVSAKVRPDGKITLPLAGDVDVAGLTPGVVRERITESLRKFIRDPNVTVMVEQINHFRIFFLGEVQTKGPIQFYRPVRLLQAIATAGGLTDFSNKRITILREEDGIEKRIEVDYKKLWAGEPGHENLLLKPGDTLLVK